MEDHQVTLALTASLSTKRVPTIIYAVGVVSDGDAQQFVSLIKASDTLVEGYPTSAPWGPLSAHRADDVHAHLTDQLWKALLVNIGVQGDLGVMTD